MQGKVQIVAKGDLYVIESANKLCKYIFTITDKSPKKFRFSFVTRLHNYGFNLMEKLIEANDTYVVSGNSPEARKRAELQRNAMTILKLMGYVGEMAYEQKCILPKHFKEMSKQIFETQKLLAGWIKSDQKRFF